MVSGGDADRVELYYLGTGADAGAGVGAGPDDEQAETIRSVKRAVRP